MWGEEAASCIAVTDTLLFMANMLMLVLKQLWEHALPPSSAELLWGVVAILLFPRSIVVILAQLTRLSVLSLLLLIPFKAR